MQRAGRHVRRTAMAGVTMKNACRGSGFDVRVSRPFLEPGEETECGWCHQSVAVTSSRRLRAHSTTGAPIAERVLGRPRTVQAVGEQC